MMNPMLSSNLERTGRALGGQLRLAPLLLLCLALHSCRVTSFSASTARRPASIRRYSSLVADSGEVNPHDAASFASEWYAPPPPPPKEESVKLPAGVMPDVRTIASHVELQEFLAEDDRLCVIKFYASWCKSCQKFGLHFDKLAAQKADWINRKTGERFVDRPEGEIRVACIEYGSCTALCRSLGIKKLPTVNFYKDGQKVGGLAAGPSQFSKVREALKHYLSLSDEESRFEAEMDRGSSLMQKTTTQALAQQAQRKTQAVVSAGEPEKTLATSSEKPGRRRSWFRRRS